MFGKKRHSIAELENRFIVTLQTHQANLLSVCQYYYPTAGYEQSALYNDIVMKLWKQKKQLLSINNPAPWIFRVANNEALSHIRRDKRLGTYRIALTSAMIDTVPNEDDDPRIATLYHIIGRLTPDEQELIYRYLDRQPLIQMASESGTSVENIKIRIYRTKQKMIKLAKEDNSDL